MGRVTLKPSRASGHWDLSCVNLAVLQQKLSGNIPLPLRGYPSGVLHRWNRFPTTDLDDRLRPSLSAPATAVPGPCAYRMITNMTSEFPTKPTTNTTE